MNGIVSLNVIHISIETSNTHNIVNSSIGKFGIRFQVKYTRFTSIDWLSRSVVEKYYSKFHRNKKRNFRERAKWPKTVMRGYLIRWFVSYMGRSGTPRCKLLLRKSPWVSDQSNQRIVEPKIYIQFGLWQSSIRMRSWTSIMMNIEEFTMSTSIWWVLFGERKIKYWIIATIPYS